jgi:hypothetical protein
MANLEKRFSYQMEMALKANRGMINDKPPPEGYDNWDDVIRVRCDNLAETAADMADYESGGGPVDPVDPIDPTNPYVPKYTNAERQAVLDMPVYNELRVHHMGLPGFVFRGLNDNAEHTQDTVYELVRQTRMAGGKFFRTFMMNGSRKAGEMYMFDALPWEMEKVMVEGRQVKKVNFDRRNQYYFDCCGVIERACKYWKIHHMPTFWMDRYNYDIFKPGFNMQGVNGYRSEAALDVKCQFIDDYMKYQHEYRPDNYFHPWEIENEPFHLGNHELGATIADQNLVMYRHAEANGADIAYMHTCSGGSEFSHANFVGEHWFASLNRFFGSDEFADRKVKPEWHGVSTMATLMADLGSGLGSGWPHLCYNEDGADDGSYNPLPNSEFRQASYDELVDSMWYGITETRKRNKKFIFTMFMMDCLSIDPVDGVLKETYDFNRMNFHRIHAYKDARIALD